MKDPGLPASPEAMVDSSSDMGSSTPARFYRSKFLENAHPLAAIQTVMTVNTTRSEKLWRSR
jgi:hypothetical protein